MNFSQIPKCYLHFEGNDQFKLSDSKLQSKNSTLTIEFKIEKNKTIRTTLVDEYRAEFKNENGDITLKQRIELSWNKKYKEYVLSNYKLIDEYYKSGHEGDTILRKFKIDDFDVHGFTASEINSPILGNYVIFPTDKMVVYFQFLNSKDEHLKSIEDFTLERDLLIKSYLESVRECTKK